MDDADTEGAHVPGEQEHGKPAAHGRRPHLRRQNALQPGQAARGLRPGKDCTHGAGDREGNRRQLNAGRTGAGTGAGAILQRVCQEGDQPRFQHSLRVRQGCEQKLYADLHQLQLHQERAGCLRRNGRRRRQSEEPPVLQESELQHRRLRRL